MGILGLVTMSFHHFGMRMCVPPFRPACIGGLDFRQPTVEVDPLNAFQTSFIRVPESPSLPIDQNEGSLVGPSRRGDRKDLAIDFAAVHSRQVHQRSVGGEDSPGSQKGIGGFVVAQLLHCIAMGFPVAGDTDNPQVVGDVIGF